MEKFFALAKYSLHCKLLKIFDRNYDAHNKIFQPYIFFFYKINFITHSTKTVVLLGIVMCSVILTVGYLYSVSWSLQIQGFSSQETPFLIVNNLGISVLLSAGQIRKGEILLIFCDKDLCAIRYLPFYQWELYLLIILRAAVLVQSLILDAN